MCKIANGWKVFRNKIEILERLVVSSKQNLQTIIFWAKTWNHPRNFDDTTPWQILCVHNNCKIPLVGGVCEIAQPQRDLGSRRDRGGVLHNDIISVSYHVRPFQGPRTNFLCEHIHPSEVTQLYSHCKSHNTHIPLILTLTVCFSASKLYKYATVKQLNWS